MGRIVLSGRSSVSSIGEGCLPLIDLVGYYLLLLQMPYCHRLGRLKLSLSWL